jgi:hypothetical protein
MDDACEAIMFVLVPHRILGGDVLRMERYVLFKRFHIPWARVERATESRGAPLGVPDVLRGLALHVLT